MKILALDSSGLVASVAVMEDDNLIAEYTMNHKKTHSQTLVPMMDEVRSMVELDLHTIDAIAVAAGPGSFTGLRIGSATAKGLGLALNKPIIPVPTVDALAFNLYASGSVICPLMDARRNQVYTGIYSFSEKEDGAFPESVRIDDCTVMNTVLHGRPMDVGELAEKINELGEIVTFTGDGCPAYAETLKKSLKVPVRFAPSFAGRQRAAAVAGLGELYLKAGFTESAAEHKPEYMRQSQAERVRDEKRGEA